MWYAPQQWNSAEEAGKGPAEMLVMGWEREDLWVCPGNQNLVSGEWQAGNSLILLTGADCT